MNEADTYAYFGGPVYVYSLKQGINDGFLTPLKVKQIATTIDEYVFTEGDELVEGELESGKPLSSAWRARRGCRCWRGLRGCPAL